MSLPAGFAETLLSLEAGFEASQSTLCLYALLDLYTVRVIQRGVEHYSRQSDSRYKFFSRRLRKALIFAERQKLFESAGSSEKLGIESVLNNHSHKTNKTTRQVRASLLTQDRIEPRLQQRRSSQGSTFGRNLS